MTTEIIDITVQEERDRGTYKLGVISFKVKKGLKNTGHLLTWIAEMGVGIKFDPTGSIGDPKKQQQTLLPSSKDTISDQKELIKTHRQLLEQHVRAQLAKPKR